MHSIILITAMTATTGLFGGKHCGGQKHHARRAVSSCYSAAPCSGGYASPYASQQAMPVASPQGYQMAPSKMAPMPSSVPPAPPVPTSSPAMPTPSSALAPASQPVVATGDLR